jgi:hypothetical protein
MDDKNRRETLTESENTWLIEQIEREFYIKTLKDPTLTVRRYRIGFENSPKTKSIMWYWSTGPNQ